MCGGGGNLFNNKELEVRKFNHFIKRDYLIANNNTPITIIQTFINNHDCVIAKPSSETLGRGIIKLSSIEDKQFDRLITEIKKKTFIIEECIKNVNYLSEINSSSLNTVRAFTIIKKNGEPEILTMILRVGKPGMYVDNWGAGGIIYRLDLSSGIITSPGKDKNQKSVIYHPGSMKQMVGWKMPDFDKLKEYIINLAKTAPEAKLVGWDIAITPKGYDFIEMNCPGGHDILQAFGEPFYDIIKKHI